jgi:hypothetical protein
VNPHVRRPGPAGRSARLLLPDPATLADLRHYVARALRVDPGGAARLIGRQDVLAMYVAPLHGAGGPTVLGLRVLRLAGLCEVDLTTALTALADRLGRLDAGLDAGLADGGSAGAGAGSVGEEAGPPAPASPGSRGEPALEVDLGLPEAAPSTAPWAGVTPPRKGWEPVGLLDVADLRAVVAAGVAEVVAGTPPTAGGVQVAALRGRVWARPLGEQLTGTPSGLAFAADALAFLDDAEPAALYRCGPWSRLTTSRGHALARPPLLTRQG